MKVKDLMSTNISCITEESSVSHIAQQMQREDVGSLPVCSQQGQLLGMVTDRDLCCAHWQGALTIYPLSQRKISCPFIPSPSHLTWTVTTLRWYFLPTGYAVCLSLKTKSWSACFPWVIWPAGRSALMKREMYCPLSVLPLVWTEICQQKIDFAAVCIYIINKNANSITKFIDFAVSPSFQ